LWNYESPTCENGTDFTPPSTSGATVIANNSASDFALLELDEAPFHLTPSLCLYYNGWDRSGSTPSNTTCIHHPAGDIKKISIDVDPLSSNGNLWRVNDWDTGTTEGGSSGSPLFDSNQRVVGQLYGGLASCENDLYDDFGKFSVSWNNSTDSRRRLRDWLDPLGTNPNTLNGAYLFPTNNSSISGPTLICSSNYYEIENLSNGANVTWHISPNYSVFQLTSDVPSTNQVLIQNKKWYSATTTLFASINAGCGDSVVFNKTIANDNDNSSIQHGSYYQKACYAYNNYFPGQSGTLNGSSVFLYPGCMTEVTLYNMFGRTVSLSGSAQPLYWHYYDSSRKLYVQLPNQSGGIPFVFRVTGDGACYSKTITFFTYSSYNLVFTPNPAIGETTLTIKTNSAEKTFDETAQWDLEVYSETQLLKTKQTSLRGQSAKIQTAGWTEGVYMVRVKYQNEILTGKLVVKR